MHSKKRESSAFSVRSFTCAHIALPPVPHLLAGINPEMSFIYFSRRRVPDPSDVEDIVQEVFYQLVEANRLLMPLIM